MEDLKKIRENIRKGLYAVADKQANVIADIYLEVYGSLPEELIGEEKEKAFASAIEDVFATMIESTNRMHAEWVAFKDSEEFKNLITGVCGKVKGEKSNG